MSLLLFQTFGLFLLSLINYNNMHKPKLLPNESPQTYPWHYLQQLQIIDHNSVPTIKESQPIKNVNFLHHKKNLQRKLMFEIGEYL